MKEFNFKTATKQERINVKGVSIKISIKGKERKKRSLLERLVVSLSVDEVIVEKPEAEVSCAAANKEEPTES